MQDDAKPSALTELADLWEAQSASAEPAARRETLRECADALHMLLSLRTNPVDTTLQPERSPTHRCKVCGAFWMEWSTNWSLCSKECGPCCDNQAMGDQIEPLIISDLYIRRTPAPAQPADVDSGMSGPQVERAEVLWANLPTGREWTSLATHEKALICHVFARAALAAMPVGGDPDAATGCADDFLPGNADDWRASLTPPADADAGLVEPTPAMINRGVDFAIKAKLSGEYTWPDYVADLYREMNKAALGQGGVR